MKIRYKHYENGVISDAPFIGARIAAISCSNNCTNCCNQHVKDFPTLSEEVDSLLDKVQSCKLNRGIILGGLEWSENPKELLDLVQHANSRGLSVIVYTGLTKAKFLSTVPQDLLKCKFYLKFGSYIESLPSKYVEEFGVTLASSNQDIMLWDPSNKGEQYYVKKLQEA